MIFIVILLVLYFSSLVLKSAEIYALLLKFICANPINNVSKNVYEPEHTYKKLTIQQKSYNCLLFILDIIKTKGLQNPRNPY